MKAAELPQILSCPEQNQVNEGHYHCLAASPFSSEQETSTDVFKVFDQCWQVPVFSIRCSPPGLLRHPFSVLLALNDYGISSIFSPKHGSGSLNQRQNLDD